MSLHLKAFNTQMTNFVHDLVREYPKDGDFIIYGEAIETLIKVNSTHCLNNFIKYAYPYKDKILVEDDKYFIDYNVAGHIDSDGDIVKLSEKIKSIWQENCTDETKATIWKYFKVLIILAEKAVLETGALNN